MSRVYGIICDSLTAITEAVRRSVKIGWMRVRHELVTAFSAGADAELTDALAVCAGSCSPQNLHLITDSTNATATVRRCQR